VIFYPKLPEREQVLNKVGYQRIVISNNTKN